MFEMREIFNEFLKEKNFKKWWSFIKYKLIYFIIFLEALYYKSCNYNKNKYKWLYDFCIIIILIIIIINIIKYKNPNYNYVTDDALDDENLSLTLMSIFLWSQYYFLLLLNENLKIT